MYDPRLPHRWNEYNWAFKQVEGEKLKKANQSIKRPKRYKFLKKDGLSKKQLKYIGIEKDQIEEFVKKGLVKMENFSNGEYYCKEDVRKLIKEKIL